MGFFDALAAVEEERSGEVPTPLKDASRDGNAIGHGQGYLYPHAYQDHWVEQQYLPTALQGRVFYQPSDQGYEATVRDQVARRREAQLAAMMEPVAEALTYVANRAPTAGFSAPSPAPATGSRPCASAVFTAAAVERHHLVADLQAGAGSTALGGRAAGARGPRVGPRRHRGGGGGPAPARPRAARAAAASHGGGGP